MYVFTLTPSASNSALHAAPGALKALWSHHNKVHCLPFLALAHGFGASFDADDGPADAPDAVDALAGAMGRPSAGLDKPDSGDASTSSWLEGSVLSAGKICEKRQSSPNLQRPSAMK